MDAVTHDLNRHLAQLDADDDLQSWRNEQAAELVEDYLTGPELYDTLAAAADDLDEAIQDDSDGYLMQLIIAAADSGDAKLEGLAKPFYDIIVRHAEALADKAAEWMDPEEDERDYL